MHSSHLAYENTSDLVDPQVGLLSLLNEMNLETEFNHPATPTHPTHTPKTQRRNWVTFIGFQTMVI